MIEAIILADSVNPVGVRLTTARLTYPRFIHAEFMTHRALSKNAASSRAIPLEKMLEAVRTKPAKPEFWASERKGMQAGDVLPGSAMDGIWLHGARKASECAENLADCGVHKSLCNRVIEPWAHISVIASGTDIGWANFFALRAHAAAMPEFQVLAYRLLAGYLASPPRHIPWLGWHIPYCPLEGIACGSLESNMQHIAPAVGRIARVSYNRDDKEDVTDNTALHDRMRDQRPLHASPFEHVAQAWEVGRPRASNFDVGYFDRSPAMSGWLQYRKRLPGECAQPDLAAVLATKPDWITV